MALPVTPHQKNTRSSDYEHTCFLHPRSRFEFLTKSQNQLSVHGAFKKAEIPQSTFNSSSVIYFPQLMLNLFNFFNENVKLIVKILQN